MNKFIAAFNLMGLEYQKGIDIYCLPKIHKNKFRIRILKANKIIMLQIPTNQYIYRPGKESMHYILKCITYVIKTTENNERKYQNEKV